MLLRREGNSKEVDRVTCEPVVERIARIETVTDVQAVTLSSKRMTLNFLTPTRIVDQKRLVKPLLFRPLVQRLMERRAALEKWYGSGESLYTPEEKKRSSPQGREHSG